MTKKKKIIYGILGLIIGFFSGGILAFCSADGIYWDQTGGNISISINGNYYTLQDVNLGAGTPFRGGDLLPEHIGNYYQYGNNYGFSSGGNQTTTTLINGSNYGPGNYYYNSHFVLASNIFSTLNTNMWGFNDGTNISMQGPCPLGYHIPTKDEFSNLLSLIDNKYTISNLESYLFLPRQGNLDYADGRLVNYLGSATYLTSSIGLNLSDPSEKSVFILWFGANNVYDLAEQPNGYGAPIRCFKNGYSEPDFRWERIVGDIIEKPVTITVLYNNGQSKDIACNGDNVIQIEGLTIETSTNTFTPYYNISYTDENNQKLIESYSKDILYLENGQFKKTYTGNNDWILSVQGNSDNSFSGYLPTFEITGGINELTESGNIFNNFAENSIKFTLSNIPSYIQYVILLIILFFILGFIRKFRRK